MVTKEQLKDWLDESAREEYGKKLEERIDKSIRENALRGKTTFYISTGEYTQDGSRKTPFYDLWYTEELSEGNRRIVQEKVIKKYKNSGFDVEKTSVDCGWSNQYFALKFKDIDKVIKD